MLREQLTMNNKLQEQLHILLKQVLPEPKRTSNVADADVVKASQSAATESENSSDEPEPHRTKTTKRGVDDETNDVGFFSLKTPTLDNISSRFFRRS